MVKHHIYENIVLLCVSLAAFLVEPAIVRSQESDYRPLGFSEPLRTSRGEVKPLSQGGEYLDRADSCRLAKQEWGWDDCEGVEFILIDPMPGIDSVVVWSPSSDGYVQLENWQNSAEEVDEIWRDFSEGMKEQSKRTGSRIEPVGWHVKPTLIADKAYLYYSYTVKWDEDTVINAKSTLFDRYGYVFFSIVPSDSNVSGEELKDLTEKFLTSYIPNQKSDYFSFENGDKIAAGGAVGVLATLMGVKYGKAVAAGFFAVALAFAKKLSFLVLVVPVMIWNWIRRKKE